MYVKASQEVHYWCFPENQDRSSSGFRDGKCSVLTESSLLFHLLVACDVLAEIATFSPTTTKSHFWGHKLNSLEKKNICIEILWYNDVLTHRTVNPSYSAENPRTLRTYIFLTFLTVTITTLHRFFLIIRNQSNCRDENETDLRYFFSCPNSLITLLSSLWPPWLLIPSPSFFAIKEKAMEVIEGIKMKTIEGIFISKFL